MTINKQVLEAKLAQLETDMDLTQTFVHGDEETNVVLGGKETPALRKMVKEVKTAQSLLLEQVREMSEEIAQETAENAASQAVIGVEDRLSGYVTEAEAAAVSAEAGAVKAEYWAGTVAGYSKGQFINFDLALDLNTVFTQPSQLCLTNDQCLNMPDNVAYPAFFDLETNGDAEEDVRPTLATQSVWGEPGDKIHRRMGLVTWPEEETDPPACEWGEWQVVGGGGGGEFEIGSVGRVDYPEPPEVYLTGSGDDRKMNFLLPSGPPGLVHPPRWSGAADFLELGSLAWGSDNKLYEAILASGPNSAREPVNPVLNQPGLGRVFSGPPVRDQFIVNSSTAANQFITSDIDDLDRAVFHKNLVEDNEESGGIFYSVDGGKTRIRSDVPRLNFFAGALHPSNGRAFAVDHDSGDVYVSDDAGASYGLSGATLPLSSTYAAMNNQGTAVVCFLESNVVAYNRNFGRGSWSMSTIDASSRDYRCIDLNDNGTAVLVSPSIRVVFVNRNLESGSWTQVGLSGGATNTYPYIVKLDNRGRGFAVKSSGSSRIYSTRDDAYSFVLSSGGSTGGNNFTGFLHRDNGLGMILHYSAALDYTIDGGITWSNSGSFNTGSYMWRTGVIDSTGAIVSLTGGGTSESPGGREVHGHFPFVVDGLVWNDTWKPYDSNAVGTVLDVPGVWPPHPDYRAATGDLLSRTAAAKLFSLASMTGNMVAEADKTDNPYMFGDGDGYTTFSLPSYPQNAGGKFIKYR